MAVIKESSIGASLTGSIGEIYYRNQNGKKVACSKPAHYRLPMDEQSIKRRDKMRRLMIISKVVTKNPFFHPIWKNSQLKGVAGYHKFVSFNHPHELEFNINKLKINPNDPEITLQVKEAIFEGNKFSVTINPLRSESGINFQREPFISVGGFVVLSNGMAEKSEELHVITLERKQLPSAAEGEMFLELGTNTTDAQKFKQFTNRTVLLMVFSLNSEEQPVKHSDTFVYRF